jgi:hypothetical protein
MVFCRGTLRLLAYASLCLVAPFASAQTQPVFPVLHYDAYAVASPLAMAEGDVNGDGIVDTLYASGSAGLSILTSSPRSATGVVLAPIAAGSVACTANSLLLADLNKDNKLDAVVTCNENAVAVLAGNGDGTFQAATTYTITSAAMAVAADFNGDGYPDLVVATNTKNTTSVFAVLLNTGANGSLAFAAPKIYSGVSSSDIAVRVSGTSQVIVGDLNDDGRADVIAGVDSNAINGLGGVFNGNGNGTFQAATYPSSSGANMALADLNGDGRLDIVSVFANSGAPVNTTVAVNFPNTSRTFVQTDVFSGMVRIQPIDVNNDGQPDIVLTGSTTTVLLNDGTGKMSVVGSYATPGSFYTARKGPSGMDLIFSTTRGFYTLHGDGKGSFDGLPSFYRSDRVAFADLNSDGLTDFVASEQNIRAHFNVIGRGDGTFALIPSYVDQLQAFPLLADWNADGVVDLVEIYSYGGLDNDLAAGGSRLLWSKGSAGGPYGPNFVRIGASLVLGVGGATSAVAGDFDNDGKLDIAVSYFNGYGNTSGLILVRGKGDGTFFAPTPLASFPGNTSARPLTADLNGDNKVDLVWKDTVFLNDGTPTPSALAITTAGIALAVGDLNGDNIPDLVLDNAIYAGNGDGTFQSSPLETITTPTGATLISASIGDVNGDGHPDLVIQHMTDMAGFTVAFGDGTGTFIVDPNIYTTGAKTPVVAGFARLNNQSPAQDNRLDYVVASDSAVVSLLNQTNPTPGPPLRLPTQVTFSNPPVAVPLQPISVTVQLTAIGRTGTVTFTSSDGTVLGKIAVNGGISATLSYAFPVPGNYTVTASYSGDSIDAPSVSAPIKIAVAKKTPTITLLVPFSNIFYTGHNSTLDAFLFDAYNPTAPMNFLAGSTVLGTAPTSSGQSHITYKFPVAGTYSLSASYPGDASNLPATSPTYTVNVVDGPDFSISSSPMTNTVKAGESATYTLSITPIRGYSGSVNFTCAPACPAAQLYVGSGLTATIPFTVQTKSPGTGGGGPNLSYGPVGAALLMLGLGRKRWKGFAAQMRLGLLVVLFAVGMLSLSGCSSGSKSPSDTGANSGTPYSFSITATDDTIGVDHTVNLTLVVK